MDIKDKLAGLSEEEKKYLLNKIRSRKAAASQGKPEQEYYPVSQAQKRIYLAHRTDTTKISYNIPSACLIQGKLDLDRAKQALRLVLKKHETLRTSFHMTENGLMQKIHSLEEIAFPLSYQEVERIPEGEEQGNYIASAMKTFVKPFDLERAPLMRACILMDETGTCLLLLDLHHIISDGTSMALLVNEFADAYQEGKLTELPMQYRQYADWHNKLIDSPELKEQENFWLEQMKGELPTLDFPVDFLRPKVKEFDGERKFFHINKELTDGLKELQRKYGSTLFMTLLSVLNVTLSKYSGQEDIIVGTPIIGRHYKNLDQMIGMFVNTMALRNYPKGNMTFGAFLKEVSGRTIQAFENQDYPFDTLVDVCNVKRDASRNPIFDVLFILQNMKNEKKEMDEISFVPVDYDDGTAKFDLQFEMFPKDDEILVRLEYAKKLFQEDTIERLMEHFLYVIEQIVKNSEIKISDIHLMRKTEEERIVKEFNDTDCPYDKTTLVHSLFETEVLKHPEWTALSLNGENLSYEEVNQRANRLARKIQRSRAKLVGICLKPSFEVVISMLAVLKAGAAYLLIDHTIPSGRIQYMLNDSEADLVITSSEVRNLIPESVSVLVLDEENYSTENSENLNLSLSPDQLAYIIYTSGSTGKPKGVMIEHQGLVNLFIGFVRKMEFTPKKKILMLTSISFDVFIIETLLPLTCGMEVIIADENQKMDMEQLNQLIHTYQVEMMQATPSRMEMFFGSGKAEEALGNLKDIIIGGEALPRTLVKKVQSVTSARIHNVYGPTEASVWAAHKQLTGDGTVTIGTPLANTRVYIQSSTHQMQPIGVIGELCIAGDGVMRGYYKRDKLNQEKLADDPYVPDSRMFYTGDLARWTADGEIEIFGRMDFQVKINGHRIETGEIENCLKEYLEVSEAAVDARKEETGNVRLYAYIKWNGDADIKGLKKYVRGRLPDYMVPAFFIRTEEFPYTTSGKIDRTRLSLIQGEMEKEKEYVAPSDPIETAIEEEWEKILNIKHIGIYDDFFEAGGSSILGIRLQMELTKKGLWQEGTNFYQCRTIQEQAENCKKNQPALEEETEAVKQNLLEEVELFRGISYPENPLLEILLYMKKQFGFSDVQLLLDGVNLFSFGGQKLTMTYRQRKENKEILKETGLELKPMIGMESVVSAIETAIQKGHAVVLKNGSDYKLFYGYDEEKACFLVIQKHGARARYEKKECSYKSLESMKKMESDEGTESMQIFEVGSAIGEKPMPKEQVYYIRNLCMEEAPQKNREAVNVWSRYMEESLKSWDAVSGQHENMEESLNLLLEELKQEGYKLKHFDNARENAMDAVKEAKKKFTSLRDDLVKAVILEAFDEKNAKSMKENLTGGVNAWNTLYKEYETMKEQ